MEYETILTIQAYAKFILMFIVCVLFYAWVYSIYKRDKTGEKNYEQYSKLVLDDNIDSPPLEAKNERVNKKEKRI